MKLSPVSPRRPRTKKDKGRASLRAVVGLALVGLLALLVNVYSAPPDWWAARGVLDAQQVQDQNAAVNVGQLKAMAAKAMDEMDAKFPGGAGMAIHALVQDWRDNKLQHDQSATLNVGQLKAVAKPYYDRLVEVGARPANAGYPWPSNSLTADNNALVNAGQVKNVFSFAIPLINDTNTEGDGMPDGWELANGLNPALDDSLEDNDGDRVPNLFEFKRGTLANDLNSTPTATLVVNPAMGGISTTDNVYSTIKEALDQAALPANAYAVIEVKSGVYAESAILNRTPVTLLGELGNAQGLPVIIGSYFSRSYVLSVSTASVVDGFTLAHSSLPKGSGVSVSAGAVTPRRRLINCMIRGNDSSVILSSGAKLDLVHCTVTGNKGGFLARAIHVNSGTLNLVNSIIWGNIGSATQEIYKASGAIVTITGGSIPAIPTSIIAGGEHGGIDADPQLTPEGWLKSSSPAINRPGVAVAPASRVDIHGEPRPTVGTTPDLGADEFKDSNGDGLPDWLEGANDNAQPPTLKFVGGGNQWGEAGTVLATPVSLSVNYNTLNAPVTFSASNGGLISVDGLGNWQTSLPTLTNVTLNVEGGAIQVAQVFVKLPDVIGSSSTITASVTTGGRTVTVGTWVATFDPTLSPPTGLIATPTAPDTVRLNWTPSDLTQATTIELSIDGGATWLAAGVASAGVTTATITGVPSDTATIVRVQTGGTPTDGGGGGGLMFSILGKIAAMTPLPGDYSPELISSSFTAVSKPTLFIDPIYIIKGHPGVMGLLNPHNSYLTFQWDREYSNGFVSSITRHADKVTGLRTTIAGSPSNYWPSNTDFLYWTPNSDTVGTSTTYYSNGTSVEFIDTITLSNLYTSDEFLADREAAVPAFQNNFVKAEMAEQNPYSINSPQVRLLRVRGYRHTTSPGYGGIVGSSYGETPATLRMKKFQYKWRGNSDPNLVLNWLEVFTPYDELTGSSPIEGAAPVIEAKSWANTTGDTESPVFILDPLLRNDKKSGVYSLTPVEIVNKDKVPVTELKVADMEHSLNYQNQLQIEQTFLTGLPASSPPTVDTPGDPDRFYVRIAGLTGAQTVSVKLSTIDNPDPTYNDDATEIELINQNGVFESKSQLLVSGDKDDKEPSTYDIGADDPTTYPNNDRTHKIQLGGNVRISAIKIDGVEKTMDMRVPVPVKKTVTINVVVMDDVFLNTAPLPSFERDNVVNEIKMANKLYASTGVKIVLGDFSYKPVPDYFTSGSVIPVMDTPSGGPTFEEDRLISLYGTTSTIEDIHVFYVKNCVRPGNVGIQGTSLPEFYQGTTNGFANNLFITASAHALFKTLAHELGHLLTNKGHYGSEYETSPPPTPARLEHNLMSLTPAPNKLEQDNIGATKRLYESQKIEIWKHRAVK